MSWTYCSNVLPIPGWSGYFVSIDGEVFSQRPLGNSRQIPSVPRRLKPIRHMRNGRFGRLVVNLCRNGEQQDFNIGHLVYISFVGEVPDGMSVDHIDRNPANNTPSNLRPATRQQQSRNQSKRQGTSSRFKGVSWCKAMCKWRSSIRINGKEKSLGYFDNEVDAARAWDAAAMKIDPEFYTTNFPQSSLQLTTQPSLFSGVMA